jgi:hypothetical protein
MASEGFFSGFIEGEQAKTSQALGMQKLAEGRQTIQENDIKIETAKRSLQAQDRIMEFLKTSNSKGQPSPSDSVQHAANEMLSIADIQLQSGQTQAASKSMTTASTLMANQAYIDKQQNDELIRNSGIVHNVIDPATIHNQQEFDMAQQRIAIETGHKSPYMGQKYSPELVKAIHDSAVSVKDEALIKDRLSSAKLHEEQYKVAEFNLTKKLPAETSLIEARERNLGKVGAKDLIPTSGDLRGITDLAEQYLGPGSVDPTTLRAASRKASEEARTLIKRDGMKPSEAYKTAFEHAKAREDFAGLKLPKGAPGSSKDFPMTMKSGMTKDQLKPNMYYALNDGTVAVWDPKARLPDGTVGPGFVVPPEGEETPGDEVEEGTEDSDSENQ